MTNNFYSYEAVSDAMVRAAMEAALKIGDEGRCHIIDVREPWGEGEREMVRAMLATCCSGPNYRNQIIEECAGIAESVCGSPWHAGSAREAAKRIREQILPTATGEKV